MLRIHTSKVQYVSTFRIPQICNGLSKLPCNILEIIQNLLQIPYTEKSDFEFVKKNTFKLRDCTDTTG